MTGHNDYFRLRKVFLKNCTTDLLGASKETIDDMIAYLQATREMTPDDTSLEEIIKRFYWRHQEEYGSGHINSRSITLIPGHHLYDDFVLAAGDLLPDGFNSPAQREERIIQFIVKYTPAYSEFNLIGTENDIIMKQRVDHVLCRFKV